MRMSMKLNRLELAGSLGDLGTLLPLAMGMIMINGLNPSGVFFCIGLFYLLSGLYFGITTPVQPMKAIGAYAIAASLSASQIMAAALLMAILLMILGTSGAIEWLAKRIPKVVIRGVQFSTGVVLMIQGVKCIVGISALQMLKQASEPYLTFQHFGYLPVGIGIGVFGVILTLLLLNNRQLPAGLIVIGFGLLIGLLLGTHHGFDTFGIQIGMPALFPYGMPAQLDLTFAFFALVIPQTPLTVGNAVFANADLANQYFGPAACRVTGKALCVSMSLANLLAFIFGGMPMCHGAGGLAAHYRFGARTAGSNLMIGLIILICTVLFSDQLLALFYLIPFAILGVLLLFAGGQLALALMDLRTRSELFVAVAMLAITLTANLAYGFCAGLVLLWIIRLRKVDI
jgi:SulP family sulfate permease